MTATRTPPDAKCPIRPGDACSLCQPGVTGPQDCGLVYLVMSDPDLRAELDRVRREGLKESRRTTERPATSHEGTDRSTDSSPPGLRLAGTTAGSRTPR